MLLNGDQKTPQGSFSTRWALFETLLKRFSLREGEVLRLVVLGNTLSKRA
jgi:hypothetical protein